MKKNKQNFFTTSWNFKLDKVNIYAYQLDVFSKKQCDQIIKIGKEKGLIKGTVLGKNIKNVRKSNISWLYPGDNLEWAYRTITDVVLSLNEQYFNFDIFGLNEGLQFTNYKAPQDKYGKHVDRAYDLQVRKLSFSILLTDPKQYEGGDLNLYTEEDPMTLPKQQGSLILFPSFVMHEVTPVTKGERSSLVGWITGNQFK